MSHAPGHVREPFRDWLDEFGPTYPADSPTGRRLAGSVWQCTDILPGTYCEQLDIRVGSTYAQAARELLGYWKRRPRSQMPK